MDFNTAVERIGFPLAVLLFEDALPENTWQTAAVDQCLHARHAFTQNILGHVGGIAIPPSIRQDADKRLQEIVAQADFQTAKALCRKKSGFLWKLAYERLFQLVSSFEEASEIGEVMGLWSSASSGDLQDPERARVTQLCFSLATRREHFAKLFSHLGSPGLDLVGRLSKEDELTAAKKLLGDNPSNMELLLGYRFPPDHPRYVRALDTNIKQIVWAWDFCDLYEKVVEFPKYRTKVGTALRERLKSEQLLNHHSMYPYRRVYELARECGDEETAKDCYDFVVANLGKLTKNKDDQQRGYRWIVEHADPESDEYKKFKPLIPERKHRGRPQKEQSEVL